jgi:hypothetical protein
MYETGGKSGYPFGYGAQAWFAERCGVTRRTVHRWCEWTDGDKRTKAERRYVNSNPALSEEGRAALKLLDDLEGHMRKHTGICDREWLTSNTKERIRGHNTGEKDATDR